jgi:heme-degrading monooxygenase HmoA
MLARIWNGVVRSAKAHAHREFILAKAMPDYRSTPGNLSVPILQRAEQGVTYFITVTLWDTVDAIRACAGPDETVAKYYPENQDFLPEFEKRAIHYVVVGGAH